MTPPSSSSSRLSHDVAELAAIERPSASAGEWRSAEWVAGRLTELGLDDVRFEPYRGARHYGPLYAVLFALGALGSRLLAAKALVLFELDFSTRWQPLRRLMPRGEGTNVTGRLPARGERRRTLVVVAHHDAARTGLAFLPALQRAGDRRAARTGRRTSQAVLGELALVAAACGVRAARPALVALAAVLLHGSRAAVVPGANDNASGVAGVLAVLERLAAERPDGMEVVALFPGGEEAGAEGMSAWLAGEGLDPATTLVVGLDTVGSGEPAVLEAEGGVWPVRYHEEDVALVERAAHEAAIPVKRWRLGALTDPVRARLVGVPAISLVSVKEGGFPHYHLPSDLPEHVDYSCVEECARLAVAVVHRWAADR